MSVVDDISGKGNMIYMQTKMPIGTLQALIQYSVARWSE
jgi:hypothetical protein